MRKALVIIGFAAIACGGQETGTTAAPGAAEGETPAVSAVQPPSETDVVGEVEEAETAEVGGEQITEVTTCLELVNGGKYAEAVDICQTAVSLAPDNAEVARALAKAQGAAAMEGATGAAAAAAGAATATAKEAASGAAAAAGGAIDSAAGAAKGAIGAGEQKAAEGAEKVTP